MLTLKAAGPVDIDAGEAAGWRLRTRAMTFIRRKGAHDSGRPRVPAMNARQRQG